jgi:hypothetical protein
MANQIATGTKVKIVKGCKAFDLPKGVLAKVIEVKELGPDFNYNVSVTLKFLNGFKSGQTKTLQARHLNRLSDDVIRLGSSNPLNVIEIVRAG